MFPIGRLKRFYIVKGIAFSLLLIFVLLLVSFQHKDSKDAGQHRVLHHQVIDEEDDETFMMGLINGLGRLQLELDAAQHKMPAYNKPLVKKKVFLVSSWRSGSSFVGELINSAPGVFYSFEPLHYFQYHKPRPNSSRIDILRSVFNCQFSEEYLMHMAQHDTDGQSALSINRRVLEACQHDINSLCVRPDFVNKFCEYFTARLVKEVRLTLTEVHNGGLVDEEDDVEWKVIYLVRDPRAVISSRQMFTWCKKNPKCSDTEKYCSNLSEDLALFRRLKAERPDRYYLLKYEDLITNLGPETGKLFEFLGLAVTPAVRLFLHTHRSETVWKAYSTYRKGNVTLTKWRKKLPPLTIQAISEICSPVLNVLNYSLN